MTRAPSSPAPRNALSARLPAPCLLGPHRSSVATKASGFKGGVVAPEVLCGLNPSALRPPPVRALDPRAFRPTRPRPEGSSAPGAPKTLLLVALDTRLLTAAPKIAAGYPGGSLGRLAPAASTPAPCALRRVEPLPLAPRDQRGLDRRDPRPPMPPKTLLLVALDTRLLTAAPKIAAGDPGGSFGPLSGAKRPLQRPW